MGNKAQFIVQINCYSGTYTKTESIVLHATIIRVDVVETSINKNINTLKFQSGIAQIRADTKLLVLLRNSNSRSCYCLFNRHFILSIAKNDTYGNVILKFETKFRQNLEVVLGCSIV